MLKLIKVFNYLKSILFIYNIPSVVKRPLFPPVPATCLQFLAFIIDPSWKLLLAFITSLEAMTPVLGLSPIYSDHYMYLSTNGIIDHNLCMLTSGKSSKL